MADNKTDPWSRLINLSSSESFWDQYTRGRPKIPPTTWERFVKYHIQHGNGQFTHVHDLGAGPGIHSAALAKHFSHVTVTDPSRSNIEAATTHFGKDSKQFTCRIGRGEDPITAEETEKYDMVFCSASLHWMDKKAVSNIATSLKPGGTFVAILVGFPDMTDEVAYRAFVEWFRRGLDLIIEQSPSPTSGYSTMVVDDNYDSIEMSKSIWENITRIKVNKLAHKRRGFITPKFLETYSERFAETIEGEIIIEEDRNWLVTTDLEGLHDILGTFPFPSNPKSDERLWDVLNQVYKSKPVEILFGLPILLATKKV